MLAAKYTVDKLKLYAGYEWIQYQNPSDSYAALTGFTDVAGDFICFKCNTFNGTTLSTTAFNGGNKILQIA